MPPEPCPLHDEIARQLQEVSHKLDKLLEKHNEDTLNRAERLSVLEAKVGNLTYVIGVCGITLLGRIIYDIVSAV